MKNDLLQAANIAMWIFSGITLFAFWGTLSKIGLQGWLNRMSGHSPSDFAFATAWISICFWWVGRYFFKGTTQKLTFQSSTATIFLLKNILAPILVSYIIMSITGSPSLTIVSVPIVGILSANIGIG